MDPTTLIKALLIQAAYQGATAVCEPLIQSSEGKPIPIDPLIQDLGLRQKGVLVYEEAKVQYAAILRAFQDKTGIWPDPQVASSGALGNAASSVVPAVLKAAGQVVGAAAKSSG